MTTHSLPLRRRTDARPARSAPRSRRRRVSEVVLVSGSVLAVAAVFGPEWLTRVGVVVAVAAAVVSVTAAWRELFHARRDHAVAMLEASRRHGAQLQAERSHAAGVVETLRRRLESALAQLAEATAAITALRGEVATLEGERSRLRTDLETRDRVVFTLRGTVRAQDVELQRLQREVDAHVERAEVHHLPRRAETGSVEGEREDSVVLDLRELRGAEPVLPNYEASRRSVS